jgi:4-hydroxybenzoate polyprenyltransferase
MLENCKKYFILMRLNKPIGILLLLWPTLWALWLAHRGLPNYKILGIFIAGVVLMRSAGCVINDFADRHFDAHVQRTAARPLATGSIDPKRAILLFVVLTLIAFILVLRLNEYTILLAFVGALLAVAYPFMKRFTHLPQVGLGLAFSWGVPMAFAAENNTIPFSAWVLFFTAILWPVIYDTMYAMTDRDDDVKIGLKSTAILFAGFDRLIIGVLQSVFLLGLLYVGVLFKLNNYYNLSLVMVAGFFVYQQILIKNRDRQRCFQAFLNNHWVGLVIFVGILLGVNI